MKTTWGAKLMTADKSNNPNSKGFAPWLIASSTGIAIAGMYLKCILKALTQITNQKQCPPHYRLCCGSYHLIVNQTTPHKIASKFNRDSCSSQRAEFVMKLEITKPTHLEGRYD